MFATLRPGLFRSLWRSVFLAKFAFLECDIIQAHTAGWLIPEIINRGAEDHLNVELVTRVSLHSREVPARLALRVDELKRKLVGMRQWRVVAARTACDLGGKQRGFDRAKTHLSKPFDRRLKVYVRLSG